MLAAVPIDLRFVLQLAAPSSSAVSPEARAVQEISSQLAKSRERSIALFGKKSEALSDLFRLAAECAQDNWDGDASAAISSASVFNAARFIRLLPDSVPLPEFSP